MKKLKIGIGLTLAINLLATSAFSQTPLQFGYGCGTGCSTKAKLISPINGYRSADG